ncbi:hypothetical protein [Marinobacter sp. VGCF2001]|uniref:hypothetical protein n=1 Tax=Marinobacter sp. VGCF2001 TaxID=3417189 RepID=UPI003CF10F36
MVSEQDLVNTLNAQTARIGELVEHVSALEYMLAQTLTIAIRNDANPEATLQDLQVLFAEKGAQGGIDSETNPGFQCASRIFSSVKASI